MQDVVSNVCPNMEVHQIVTANVQIGVHISNVIHVGIHVSRYQGRRVWIAGRRGRWRAVRDRVIRLVRMTRVGRMLWMRFTGLCHELNSFHLSPSGKNRRLDPQQLLSFPTVPMWNFFEGFRRRSRAVEKKRPQEHVLRPLKAKVDVKTSPSRAMRCWVPALARDNCQSLPIFQRD
jgi:hypothetical protein